MRFYARHYSFIISLTGLALLGLVVFPSIQNGLASNKIRAAQSKRVGEGAINRALAQYRVHNNFIGESYDLPTASVDTYVTLGLNDQTRTLTARVLTPSRIAKRPTCRLYEATMDLTGESAQIVPGSLRELNEADCGQARLGPNQGHETCTKITTH